MTTTLVRPLWIGVFTLASAISLGAAAQEQDDGAQQWAAALAAMVRGRESVTLLEQGLLDVPEGFGFVPKAEATTLMQLMGNQVDERFVGLVLPLTEGHNYFVTLDYEASGYIEDDEAAEWDADANLITTASTVADDRRAAAPLLSAVSFSDGKRYQDFDSSTDKIAAYGLTALIGGVAAKKLGLIAVATAFVVKFAKVIILGAIGLAAAVRTFFAKRK